MKKIAQFFRLFYQAYHFLYKKYHCWKSGGRGMVTAKFEIAGEDENGEAIFKIGKEEIVYRSEPHIVRAEKKLAKFKKFLDDVQKLPPGNHPWWHRKFDV